VVDKETFLNIQKKHGAYAGFLLFFITSTLSAIDIHPRRHWTISISIDEPSVNFDKNSPKIEGDEILSPSEELIFRVEHFIDHLYALGSIPAGDVYISFNLNDVLEPEYKLPENYFIIVHKKPVQGSFRVDYELRVFRG